MSKLFAKMFIIIMITGASLFYGFSADILEGKLKVAELSDGSKYFYIKYDNDQAKHFDTKCQAYTKWGIRCKNRVKSEVKGKFCKVHVNFYSNILSTLENVIPRDIANICLKFIFTYD